MCALVCAKFAYRDKLVVWEYHFHITEFWCVCVDCLTLTGTATGLGRIYLLFTPKIWACRKKIGMVFKMVYSFVETFSTSSGSYSVSTQWLRWYSLVLQCCCIIACFSCPSACVTLKQVGFLIWLFLGNRFFVFFARFGLLILLTIFSRSELWK